MGSCRGYQKYTEHKDNGTENGIFLMFKLMVTFI
jgi:hypothetical protein